MRYLSALPIDDLPISLGEGSTPLIKSKVFEGVYIKNEGMNPTGNFKDRESALTLAYASAKGLKNLAIASSGNAGLSAALYSKVHRINTTCYVPEKTPAQKVGLVQLFGARLHIVGKTYEEGYRYLLNNLPMGSENITSGAFSLRSDGAKTIAYEIWEQLGCVPDTVVVPCGNGSVLAAVYHGFAELRDWGLTNKVPAMISVQIKGADPINQAFANDEWIEQLKDSEDSICEAIVANESYCSPKAIYALRESKGFGVSVTDHQVIDGLRFAIDMEGVFPEVSSASVFSALLDFGNDIRALGKNIVLLNTATGVKDTESTRQLLGR